MTEFGSAAATCVRHPQPSYSKVGKWIKFASIGCLALAGVFWLFPQYDYIGEEYHIFLEYYEYWNLGSSTADAPFLLIVWAVLIAAAAAVWHFDRPDQPLGRASWIAIPLILAAMVFVAWGQSTPADLVPPADDRNWTDYGWEETTGHTFVWVGLWLALLSAVGMTIYSRAAKPPLHVAPSPAFITTPPHQPANTGVTLAAPDVPAPAPKSTLEQKLDEYDRLRASNKITDDELATLRARALNDL